MALIDLQAALFKESRTRGPREQREVGNPGTELRSRQRGGLVVDVEEAHDFAIVDPKVVRQDQFFRKVGFVVVAIVETVHDDQRSHGPKAHPKR